MRPPTSNATRRISRAVPRPRPLIPHPSTNRPRLTRNYAIEAETSLIHVSKPSLFGQPTYHSHPHLVKPNEITPGIPSHEYERRRSELVEGLPDGSLVVSVAAQVKYMSAGASSQSILQRALAKIFLGKSSYKFRQASDFWYLTGFEEPDSAVVLEKNNSPRGYRMILFCTGKDPAKEKWEGAKTRFDDVVSIFGADEGRPIESFAQDLKDLVSSGSQVYVDLPQTSKRHAYSMKSFLKFLAGSSSAKGDYESVMEGLSSTKRKPLAPIVGKMRAIKSKYEQGVLKAAADISSKGHTKIMRLAKPGLSEADLAAHFEYICAREGAQRPAYVPVVASGENALIIHYTQNDHILRDGELVLVDAGCEYNGYASDITRTFPANGTFTPAQHELYSALLSAQKQLVQFSTASTGFSLNDLHRRSVEILREELRQIGFDLGWQGGVLERVLYPHYLAHPVGIDLHESGTVDRREPLKEGMVITIEPGVYVPADPEFPKHFHGIGIRIEDEVLVGENDPVVLSAAAPKEIVDVEGACQGLLGLEPF